MLGVAMQIPGVSDVNFDHKELSDAIFNRATLTTPLSS
jgi:hypothetical protein